MRNVKTLLGLGIVAVLVSSATLAFAQRPKEAGKSPQGPPDFVLEAWESGEAPVPPQDGPPTWVVEAWESGERPRAGGFGPPAWVVERHRMAAELGLPGPPPAVIEAWENGEGFDLPGPPEFVWEILGL